MMMMIITINVYEQKKDFLKKRKEYVPRSVWRLSVYKRKTGFKRIKIISE